MTIAPNPVKANFSLKYNAPGSGPVVIRITDMSGRPIETVRGTINKGQNLIYLQGKPTWKPGMYLVTVEQGANIQRGKFLYQ
ncbi:MAG: T9SS type A sorting domain-containing protein [Bacteroidota bacterium]